MRVCLENADTIAFQHLEGSKAVSLSFGALLENVRRLDRYLKGEGYLKGDRLAILSESRVEWPITFFSCMVSRCTAVPLDVKLSYGELSSIVEHCQPSLLFASPAQAEQALRLKRQFSCIREVVVFGDDPAPEGARLFNDLPASGSGPPETLTRNDIALICYTSGTGGAPKGVMISVDNLLYQIQMLHEGHAPGYRDVFLSILPLNHIFELTSGLLVVFYGGAHVVYVNSLFPHELMGHFSRFKVTRMVAVPMVLELIRKGIDREIAKKSWMARLFLRGLRSLARVLPSERARRWLFSPIVSKFGEQFRGFYTGGAPLRTSTARYFHLMGLNVFQGYGLTETSAALATNNAQANRFGSVGKPFPGVRVRIDGSEGGDGEILVSGPQLMAGYYRNAELTTEVIDAKGWLSTGDVGRLDDDGYLWITGRKKSMIVLGGGKKVFPEEVEAQLGSFPEVAELAVLGWPEGQGGMGSFELVCVVARPSREFAEACGNDPTRMEVGLRALVDARSAGLSDFKRPQRFFLWLDGELPKTTTQKFKRHEILKQMRLAPERVK